MSQNKRYLVEQVLQSLCQSLANEQASFAENQQKSDMVSAFEQFMEEMPGGFLIYYAERGEEIIYANQSLLRIFQCENMEEFRQHTQNSFRGLVYPDDLDEVEESIRRQIIASQYDLDYVEYRIRRKDGEIRWIEDYGHFVHNETVGDIFYVFLSDATEKHDQLLREKNRALAQSLKQANLAIESKNVFLSNLSHDMRTPLNAIFGFTSLARLNLNNPPEVEEYLGRVEAASHLLLGMIEKALEVSALSGDVEIENKECDLQKIVHAVYDKMHTQAAAKAIEFVVDCSEVKHSVIYSDAEKLTKLLLCLVGNAVNYTPNGGLVQIIVKEDLETLNDYATYHLTVQDNGIGISPDYLEHIFEPFSREKNSTLSGVHAIGLGLTIAKSIVDLLGGTIDVESEQNRGSIFTVNLSLRFQELPQASPPAAAPARKVRSILLVEDNEINREIEMELLERMGFEVCPTENGQEALDKVKASAPGDFDLVLMDLQMPVMDGWQAAVAIRALPDAQLANLPIIALSANVSERDQKKSRDSGIDAHLIKPMDLPLLRKTIEELTEKKRL